LFVIIAMFLLPILGIGMIASHGVVPAAKTAPVESSGNVVINPECGNNCITGPITINHPVSGNTPDASNSPATPTK
jgi:hypothetical protein